MKYEPNPIRVAVFIDGDNLSATHAKNVLSKADSIGRVDLARVYCNGNSNSKWFDIPGFRALTCGTTKNAADILLCIDAMEFACTGTFDAIVIGSSDGDFTHLAQRLRERGLPVIGLGEEKAPPKFRKSCSHFSTLPTAQKSNAKSKSEAPATAPSDDLNRNIRSIIANESKKGQGLEVVKVGVLMNRKHGTHIKNHPDKTWRKYFTKPPELFEIDPAGPGAKVRFLPSGFERLPTAK
jgi:uncharacterized LabA/DUF88 family protein